MNVFDLQARIGLDTSDYDKGLDNSESKISKFGQALSKGIGTAVKAVGAATAAAIAATGAFVKSAVDAGSQFDSSMSQVAATMGTTVDQIGELREFAQKMGSETAFSASQAADALNYMALAGYDAEKSMSMLPTVLDLAAAGGMELAQASDMVTDAQSALGLTMEETEQMVNMMAVTSSKTNTSVAQLGDAILTVGGTAKSLKGGTQELAQTLGIMADNGIKASEAGTHMRNIMLAMNPTTDAATAAWEKLGVQAYDSQGQLRNMSDIFGELSTAMADMSDQEKTETLTAMFNKTDLAAINALLDTSAERWTEVSDAIGDYEGAASQMATTQLDNLNGKITLFKSAWEGLQIVISDMVTPSLKNLVDFGAEGVSKITKGIKEGGLTGGFKAFGEIVKDVGVKLKKGIVDAAPKIASAIPDIIKGLMNGFKDRINMILEIAPVILGGIAEGITENLPDLMNGAISIINGISGFINDNLSTFIDTAITIVVAIADGISDALPELIPAVIDIILTIVDKLTEPNSILKLLDAALKIILAIAEGLMKALPNLLNKGEVIITKFANAIIKAVPKLAKAAVEMVAMITGTIIANLGKILDVAAQIIFKLSEGLYQWSSQLYIAAVQAVDEIRNGFANGIEEAKQWGKDLIDNFVGGIKQKWEDLKSAVTDVAQTVQDFLGFSEPKEGPLSNFHTYAPDMIDLFTKGIKENEKKLQTQFESSFDFSGSITAPTASSASGSNIVINITSGVISSDYDAYRAASKISEQLAILKRQERAAMGA